MKLPRPIRPLVRLLEIVSSRDGASAEIGDMIEELRERHATGRGPRRPRLWMNTQTLAAIGSATRASARRSIRSAGLLLRDAVRGLRAAPASSLFIVFVLAVGITAGTVTFSVVDAVLLKPLPLEEPDRIVRIPTWDQNITDRITPEAYWRLHEGLTTVQSLAARFTWSGATVTVGGTTTDTWEVAHTTSDFFEVLRLSPAIGRFWSADEEARGAMDVAVLGYGLWQDEFGGDPSVLGQTIAQGSRTRRIIGVLSAPSNHPDLDIVIAPILVPLDLPRTGTDNPFGIIARMRPGVSASQVAQEVQALLGSADWRPDVTSLIEPYVTRVRSWMLLALGAAGIVVLIACVNAANLMLTRSTGRAQELAIRSSLGASRRRIAGTVLAEGLLLSFGATTCALLCATIGVRLARFALTTMPLGVFRASSISLNGRVLAAAIAAAAITGVVVSLVPAWQTSRAPVSMLLKDTDGTTATGRRRWRSVFLTTEVASVVVLLVVSWLFVVSLIRVMAIDIGIDRTNLLAVKPNTEYQGTVDEVRQRLESVPGVSGVAVATGASLPLIGRAFGGAWGTTPVERIEASPGTAVEPAIKVMDYHVTPNYFDVAGVTFLRGGTWSAETAFSSPAAVLDEQAARELFGDEDPMGGLVRDTERDRTYRIVGIVPHVYARGPEETDPPTAYFPLRPNPARNFAGFFVKTSRSPEEMVPEVVEALKPVAPATSRPYVFVADEALSRITATRRFNAGLMSAFGLVGVLIGAAGVYAVMASFVAQQTREIGVRLALGATPARIQRNVLALAWRHLLVGLALGVPVAWWLSRGFATLLFQVTPADVSVYGGVAILLIAVGFLAAWVPARRAAQVDPIISLRR